MGRTKKIEIWRTNLLIVLAKYYKMRVGFHDWFEYKWKCPICGATRCVAENQMFPHDQDKLKAGEIIDVPCKERAASYQVARDTPLNRILFGC